MTTARPFLKWAGGKRRLLSQYAKLFPAFATGQSYYEPFLGGGAVFFELQPAHAVLTDINDELVNCYKMVRDHLDEVVSLVVEHRRHHSKKHYYELRERDLGHMTSIEQAARFIYLNRTCFNGLYRVNSRGKFNVPMGRYKNPMATVEATLAQASRALQQASIEVAPFERVLDTAHAGDFVYFDPPYQPISKTSNFTSYSKGSFGEDSQRHLAQVFKKLTKLGVRVMLSNSDHPLIRKLYRAKRHRIIEVTALRAINSKASKRGAIGELVILNY